MKTGVYLAAAKLYTMLGYQLRHAAGQDEAGKSDEEN